MSGSRGRWQRQEEKRVREVQEKIGRKQKREVKRSDIALHVIFYNWQAYSLFFLWAIVVYFQYSPHFCFIYSLLLFPLLLFFFCKPLFIHRVLLQQSWSKLVSVMLSGLIYIYITFRHAADAPSRSEKSHIWARQKLSCVFLLCFFRNGTDHADRWEKQAPMRFCNVWTEDSSLF